MIGLQNKNALYAPLLLALLLVFFNSCKEETKTISDTGKDYYPITVGSSFIYTVDSFLYDGINKRIDSSSTVMRDEVVQLLTDSAGENYFLIQRSIQIDSITYDVFLSFASYIYPGSVQSNLYNSREVRMSFPITAFKNWDGNLYNNKAFEEFTYENIQEAFEVNGQVFDNTVTWVSSNPIVGSSNT